MGVAWEDCPVVAELLGMKLFLNEFVAYQGLSEYKQRRLAGTEEWVGSKKQWISVSVPLPLLGQGMMQLSLCRLAETHRGGPQPPTSRCPGQQDSLRLHCHLSQGLSLLASLVAQLVKNPPAVQKTWVLSLGWEAPLEKGKATHSSILAWRIPWTV